MRRLQGRNDVTGFGIVNAGVDFFGPEVIGLAVGFLAKKHVLVFF